MHTGSHEILYRYGIIWQQKKAWKIKVYFLKIIYTFLFACFIFHILFCHLDQFLIRERDICLLNAIKK